MLCLFYRIELFIRKYIRDFHFEFYFSVRNLYFFIRTENLVPENNNNIIKAVNLIVFDMLIR